MEGLTLALVGLICLAGFRAIYNEGYRNGRRDEAREQRRHN